MKKVFLGGVFNIDVFGFFSNEVFLRIYILDEEVWVLVLNVVRNVLILILVVFGSGDVIDIVFIWIVVNLVIVFVFKFS